ncbi:MULTISPECIES: DUF6415 family natural product biosynthesis protein [Streptomyces]|uniref:DUF6415 family natural product biosynthesis protein n=1 Tax=Streptomyces TaxID=1883 RepID=UPI0023B01FDB|nr:MULTISPECIES: DUF6415 family natural product biosynthesis protein [Streptomyces]MDI7789210.1 DUF6415 family natural product biosynthesis protein [Streptomyces cavourensis]
MWSPTGPHAAPSHGPASTSHEHLEPLRDRGPSDRLRSHQGGPVSEVRRALDRVLGSPVPEQEVAYPSWRLRSWHQLLSTIATADRWYPPNARTVLLTRAGKVLGDEQGGGSSAALGRLCRLAKITSELLARVVAAHRFVDPADGASIAWRTELP